ncbi:XdhC family protein [Dyella sp. C9]|uniref:XdhC family protein n=1 Tax=Dyella sp. C9 TaxID=2202154 RepID=UPI000DEF8AC2|nr:XdhC/CoxI family protein [Dyella sp. C9]
MNVTQEFESLYRAARSLALRGEHSEAALVTITRTQGSTFRRAGASMLVHRDGRLVCELSGGCPQRDIVLRAQHAMDIGEPSLVAYGRDSNYDVMIETGCGGELEVLIEPWRRPDDIDFLDAIDALRARRATGAMASLYATDGSTRARHPLRFIRSEGRTWANMPPASAEWQVLAGMLATEVADAAITMQVESAGQHHHVLLESLQPPHALVVIGDGIGADMLAQLSLQLGWHTTLVGTVESATTTPHGARRLVATPRGLVSAVTLDPLTSVVVMTHRLERDLAYLSPLLAMPVRYIGVIGSRERAQKIRAAFPRADDRLHVPAGLDVGSETPQEIALAIAAEILATRNGRAGGPLTHSLTSIHP